VGTFPTSHYPLPTVQVRRGREMAGSEATE